MKSLTISVSCLILCIVTTLAQGFSPTRHEYTEELPVTTVVIDIDPEIGHLMGHVRDFYLGMDKESLLKGDFPGYKRLAKEEYDTTGEIITYTDKNNYHIRVYLQGRNDEEIVAKMICWNDPKLVADKLLTLENYIAFPELVEKADHKGVVHFKHKYKKLIFIGNQKGCIFR